MAIEKQDREQLRKTRNMLGVVVGILTLLIGLAAAGCIRKLKEGTSDDEAPSPPFRITDLADQEALCAAIKESDEFNFEDSADVPVYVSCQIDKNSMFGCMGDGSLLSVDGLCGFFGNVCPCEPGQIINREGLDGDLSSICLEEIDPNNPFCTELQGDLEGLLKTGVATTF